MAKRILIFFTIVIFLLILTGCQTKENKAIIKQYEAQAKINTEKYLKEKYNITNVKIVSTYAYLDCEGGALHCSSAPPNGRVHVTCQYNDIIFDVFIDGNKETTSGTDNYQYDTIEKDVINYFKNYFLNEPLEIIVDLNILQQHGSLAESYKEVYPHGLKDLYHSDGKEFFKYISSVKIYFCDMKSLDSLELDNLKEELIKGEVLLFNFRSKEDYIDYKKDYNTLGIGSDGQYYSGKYLQDISGYIYLKDAMRIYYQNSNYYSFDNITNYEDDIYIHLPYEERKVDVNVVSPDNISNYTNSSSDYTNSSELLKGKKPHYLSKSFSVKCNKDDITSNGRSNIYIYIYFDKRKLNINDTDKVFIATSWYKNGEKEYLVDDYDRIHNVGSAKETDLYYYWNYNYYCDEGTDIVFSLIGIN